MTPSLARPRLAPARRRSRERARALGGTAAVATAAFGAMAVAVARRDTAHADRRLRDRVTASRGHPARRVAHAVAAPGKWWAYLPAAVGVAAYVLHANDRSSRGLAGGARALVRRLTGETRRRERSRRAGAGAVVLASALAAVLGPVFDRVLPQPPAPPGHPSSRDPVFPSGHAFGPTAMALTSAYVLGRESFGRSGVALPVALAYPLLSGGGKIVEDRHWTSDVVGGWLAGLALSAACLAAYERYGRGD